MKTKLLLIILLGILSSGCQIIERGPLWQTESNIDNELLPYYEAFLDEREKLGFVEELPHINIVLEEVDKNWRGKCAVAYAETNEKRYITDRTISISQRHYDNVIKRDGKDYHKGIEMLIFHEIAHCFWEAPHVDKEYPRTVKIYDHETAGDVYDEIICRDLMHYKGITYRGTRDYLCYTQHYDLYKEQLYAIMSNQIQR